MTLRFVDKEEIENDYDERVVREDIARANRVGVLESPLEEENDPVLDIEILIRRLEKKGFIK